MTNAHARRAIEERVQAAVERHLLAAWKKCPALPRISRIACEYEGLIAHAKVSLEDGQCVPLALALTDFVSKHEIEALMAGSLLSGDRLGSLQPHMPELDHARLRRDALRGAGYHG